MKNIQEKFIVERSDAGEYLILLPDGSIQVVPSREAVLDLVKKRGKQKVRKADMHTATIEWRDCGEDATIAQEVPGEHQ